MNGRQFAAKRGRILHHPRSQRWARKAIAKMAREAGGVPVYVGARLVGHEFPDGFIVCELRRYRDEAHAMAELQGVRAFAHLHDHRLPKRAFLCNRCGGWHTTSRE